MLSSLLGEADILERTKTEAWVSYVAGGNTLVNVEWMERMSVFGLLPHLQKLVLGRHCLSAPGCPSSSDSTILHQKSPVEI